MQLSNRWKCFNLNPGKHENYIYFKVWDEITYTFWEWISNFIPRSAVAINGTVERQVRCRDTEFMLHIAKIRNQRWSLLILSRIPHVQVQSFDTIKHFFLCCAPLDMLNLTNLQLWNKSEPEIYKPEIGVLKRLFVKLTVN